MVPEENELLQNLTDINFQATARKMLSSINMMLEQALKNDQIIMRQFESRNNEEKILKQ